MFPEDLVRLCRAAGLMDGPHAFSNPDIISIAVGVIETLNEGSIPADASLVGIDTAMDFRAFCVALSEIARFRFSRAESPQVAQRTLFRRVLGPLALHVMASDLVPQAAVTIIHDQHERLKESQELREKMPHDDASDDGDYAGGGGGYDGQMGQHSSSNRVPGVVGGTEGLLDPLIGLAPDPFEMSRARVEVCALYWKWCRFFSTCVVGAELTSDLMMSAARNIPTAKSPAFFGLNALTLKTS